MKCIRMVRLTGQEPNTVRRVADGEARELVNSGEAVLISKKAWKYALKPKKEVVDVQALNRTVGE